MNHRQEEIEIEHLRNQLREALLNNSDLRIQVANLRDLRAMAETQLASAQSQLQVYGETAAQWDRERSALRAENLRLQDEIAQTKTVPLSHVWLDGDKATKCCSCGWQCSTDTRVLCEQEWHRHVEKIKEAVPLDQLYDDGRITPSRAEWLRRQRDAAISEVYDIKIGE